MQRKKPSTTQVSELVKDPDWDTFEEIENYVYHSRSLLKRLFFPNLLWKQLFAPTPIDAERLRHQREQVLSTYNQITQFCTDSKNQLSEKSGLDKSAGWSKLSQSHLTNVDQSCYPASVDPPEQYSSLGEYISAIETAVDTERDTVKTIKHLLSNPESAFLYDQERTTLDSAREFLEYSVDMGKTQRRMLVQRRRGAIRFLEERFCSWEQAYEELRERSDPYLNLESYLYSDDLLVEVNQLRERIASESQLGVDNWITHSIIKDCQNIQIKLSDLYDELRKTRKQYAHNCFDQVCMSVSQDISALSQQLSPARNIGQKLANETRFIEQIENIRKEINAFTRSPYCGYIPAEEIDLLTDYSTRLEEFEEFIDQKTTFDNAIKDCTEDLETLKTDLSLYLNYEKYLTRPAYEDVSKRIVEFIRSLRRLRGKIELSILAESDRKRVNDLMNEVKKIDEQLSPGKYNSDFVRIEKKRCESLFSDIGDSNLDLTHEQQKAVIKNGIYNQVIAAAGTGKTLTLTTRVAYLISAQDVDPDDILVVTYTNEATDEMRERLRSQFGITDVSVQTIQSFGYGLIQETHDGFVESIDPNEQRNFIDQQIRDARNDESSEFLDHYYEFLVHFDDVYYDEADFDTRKAYVEARLEQTYVTLKGTEVKSRAEKLIADFLFTHQVEYQYEARASWADSAADKAGYTPDFYLPNYDLYIEHWGIDESGSIAPWFSQSSEEYHEKIRWGRQQFTDTEHTLVGTYEFEHEANRLKQALRHRLTHHGVELDRLEFEALVDTAFEYDQREGWIKRRFVSFIENAKRFELKPADITAELSDENPRQYHFAHCGVHLLQQYVLYLTRNGLIDFQDMVHDAVDTIQHHPEVYNDRYEHLLVDEFQDIGKGKLELIQQLTGENAARLFAVGDDWQSIYSFQGAVIDYFTDFTSYFGDPVRTELTANFRSPSTPIEAGNHLIEHNTNQLDKTVRPTLDRDHTPRVHVLRGYQFYDYVRRVRSYTVTLVREYISAGADPADIMVLCRYDDAVPYLSEIKDGLQSQQIPYTGKSDQYRGPDGSPDGGVSVYSLYQAKGREAKHVILVHAADGPYGFPSDRREGELLDPVKPLDVGGLEEERRAFYVAITRTEHTLDFLTRAERQSQFLDEIDEYTDTIDAGQVEPLDEVGERMTVTVEVDQLLDPWAKQHQRGILADQYGGSARYVSWANTDPPTLNANEWYRLTNLKVSEFNDEKELVWTPDSTAHQLDSAPSLTTTRDHDEQDPDSTTATDQSGATTPPSTDGDTEDSGTRTGDLYRLEPDATVIDHHLYQDVLSTLAELGGEASTAEITVRINTGRNGAYDRLRTLEAHGKVTQTTDDGTRIWELTE